MALAGKLGDGSPSLLGSIKDGKSFKSQMPELFKAGGTCRGTYRAKLE